MHEPMVSGTGIAPWAIGKDTLSRFITMMPLRNNHSVMRCKGCWKEGNVYLIVGTI